MAHTPNVSIIIATYNGAKKIRGLLNSLANQTTRDFEVVVVVDGSTDNTVEVLKEFANTFNYLKVIEQANQGRAKVRNNGAKAAHGDLLIFFDDDMIPENNCVELHIHHHNEYKNSLAVGPARMNISADPNNDFYQYRFYIEENWQQPFKNQITKISHDKYAFTTGNLSLLKSVFNESGQFDERLTDSEDLDFSLRVMIKNIPIYYDYKIWTWHCDYIDMKDYIQRQKDYSRSLTKLALLKPEYTSIHPASFTRVKVAAIKRFVMKLFVYNSRWSKLINSKLFLTFVSRKIRYRLYNILIFSSTVNPD